MFNELHTLTSVPFYSKAFISSTSSFRFPTTLPGYTSKITSRALRKSTDGVSEANAAKLSLILEATTTFVTTVENSWAHLTVLVSPHFGLSTDTFNKLGVYKKAGPPTSQVSIVVRDLEVQNGLALFPPHSAEYIAQQQRIVGNPLPTVDYSRQSIAIDSATPLYVGDAITFNIKWPRFSTGVTMYPDDAYIFKDVNG